MDVAGIKAGGGARPPAKPKALADDGFADALAGALGVTAAPDRSPATSRPAEDGAGRAEAKVEGGAPPKRVETPPEAEARTAESEAAAVADEEAPDGALAPSDAPDVVVELSARATAEPAAGAPPEEQEAPEQLEQLAAPEAPGPVEAAPVEGETVVTVAVDAPAPKAAQAPLEGLRWEARVAEAPAPKAEATPAAAPPRPAPPPAPQAWTPALETSVMRQIADAVRPGADAGRRAAEIALDPAELGRVRVRVEMEGGAARVVLAAEHAHVRDLMAAGVERLRQDLLAQGVHSVDVEVRQESGGFGGREDEREPAERGERGADRAPREARAYVRRTHAGRIDVTA